MVGSTLLIFLVFCVVCCLMLSCVLCTQCCQCLWVFFLIAPSVLSNVYVYQKYSFVATCGGTITFTTRTLEMSYFVYGIFHDPCTKTNLQKLRTIIYTCNKYREYSSRDHSLPILSSISPFCWDNLNL